MTDGHDSGVGRRGSQNNEKEKQKEKEKEKGCGSLQQRGRSQQQGEEVNGGRAPQRGQSSSQLDDRASHGDQGCSSLLATSSENLDAERHGTGFAYPNAEAAAKQCDDFFERMASAFGKDSTDSETQLPMVEQPPDSLPKRPKDMPTTTSLRTTSASAREKSRTRNRCRGIYREDVPLLPPRRNLKRPRPDSRPSDLDSGRTEELTLTQWPELEGAPYWASRGSRATLDDDRHTSHPDPPPSEPDEDDRRKGKRKKAMPHQPPAKMCDHCGRSGHGIATCTYADMAGLVRGCPVHNRTGHSIEDCKVITGNPMEVYEWAVVRRANLPSLATRTPWPDMLQWATKQQGFTQPTGYPWTEEFAKEVLEKQENGDLIDLWHVYGDVRYLPVDPRTSTMEAVADRYQSYWLSFGNSLRSTIFTGRQMPELP